MNKKLRDIRDGKPDSTDDDNDVEDVEDLNLELNETFSEEQDRISSQVEQIANTRSKAKQSQTKQAIQMLADKSCTLTIDKVPKDKKVSVREAVKAVSIAGGQGVKACGCISGNCNIGKCVCFNNKVPCNSRCHKGNPNPNCLRKHEPELP
jgi:hypothetical protein